MVARMIMAVLGLWIQVRMRKPTMSILGAIVRVIPVVVMLIPVVWWWWIHLPVIVRIGRRLRIAIFYSVFGQVFLLIAIASRLIMLRLRVSWSQQNFAEVGWKRMIDFDLLLFSVLAISFVVV